MYNQQVKQLRECSSLFGVMLLTEIWCLFYLQFMLRAQRFDCLVTSVKSLGCGLDWFHGNVEQSLWAGRLNMLVQTAGGNV